MTVCVDTIKRVAASGSQTAALNARGSGPKGRESSVKWGTVCVLLHTTNITRAVRHRVLCCAAAWLPPVWAQSLTVQGCCLRGHTTRAE